MELVYYPDPRLREIAKPIEATTDELKEIVKEMFDIMYKTNGIGLAGNQVGVMQRILVINLLGDRTKPEEEKVLINPKILSRAGKETEEEACLSLPGIIAQITRAKRIKLSALDMDLKEQTIEAADLFARVLQHEIDHLDGLLIIDKMTPAEKLRLRRDIKGLEEGKRPRTRLKKAGAL